MEEIEKILISEQELKEGVERLAKQIDRDYAGKEVLLVPILKGSVVFGADLARALHIPAKMDFMQVSSYGPDAVSCGTVQIKKELDIDIAGKHVLLIEDIIDTGRTLFHLKNELLKRKPASLKICTMLDKPSRRDADLQADYTGFKVPDQFVVGYGMDYAENFRGLPYVGILKPEIYQKEG